MRIGADDWSLDELPAHLRMTFCVEDEDGTVLASGRSLEALREELRPRLAARLERAAPALARHGMRGFDIPSAAAHGRLSPAACAASRRWSTRASAVGIRICETAGEQELTMARGTRRLLRLAVASPATGSIAQLGTQLTLALAAAPHGNLDCGDRGRDRRGTRRAHRQWWGTGLGRRRRLRPFASTSAGRSGPTHARGAASRFGRILEAARPCASGSTRFRRARVLGPAREDVARQLGRLVYPGMLAATGLARLGDVERYLRAAAPRLERLPQNLASPTTGSAWRPSTRWRLQAAGRSDAKWLLEELRVAQLAPGAHVRPGATVKRVREALAVGS